MESEQTPSESTQDSTFKKQLCQVTPLSRYLALALFITLPFIGGYVGYQLAPEKVVEVEGSMSADYTDDQVADIKQLLVESEEVYTKEDYYLELRKLREEYVVINKNDDIISLTEYEDGRYVIKVGRKETEDLGRYIEIDSNCVTENSDCTSFKTFDGSSPGYGKISPNEKYLAYVDEFDESAMLIVYDLPDGKVAWSQKYDSVDPVIYDNERYSQVAVSWQDDETLLLYENNVDFIDVQKGEADYSLQGLGDSTRSLNVVTQEIVINNSGAEGFAEIVYSNTSPSSKYDIAVVDDWYSVDDGRLYTTPDRSNTASIFLRNKDTREVTKYTYTYGELFDQGIKDFAQVIYYNLEPSQKFNYELTDEDTWVMYQYVSPPKGAPGSGAIIIGNSEKIVIGEGMPMPAEFEWLSGGGYRYKRNLLCGEVRNGGDPNDYTPEGDARCTEVIGTPAPWIIDDKWIYGDISDLLNELETKSE